MARLPKSSRVISTTRTTWLTPERETRLEMMKLRSQGEHIVDIAMRFDRTPGEVLSAIREEMALWHSPNVDEVRQLEDLRLDRIMLRLERMLQDGRVTTEISQDGSIVERIEEVSESTMLEASKILAKVSDQRAKLHGANVSPTVVIDQRQQALIVGSGELSFEQLMAIASQAHPDD